MALYDGDFDITKTIKIIEKLKSQLLSDTAHLFSAMADGDDNRENIDILADIMIITYLLSKKLGIDYPSLDKKMVQKIQDNILEESNHSHWIDELTTLATHLGKYRDH